mgnify:CR=1 FL=1
MNIFYYRGGRNHTEDALKQKCYFQGGTSVVGAKALRERDVKLKKNLVPLPPPLPLPTARIKGCEHDLFCIH